MSDPDLSNIQMTFAKSYSELVSYLNKTGFLSENRTRWYFLYTFDIFTLKSMFYEYFCCKNTPMHFQNTILLVLRHNISIVDCFMNSFRAGCFCWGIIFEDCFYTGFFALFCVGFIVRGGIAPFLTFRTQLCTLSRTRPGHPIFLKRTLADGLQGGRS